MSTTAPPPAAALAAPHARASSRRYWAGVAGSILAVKAVLLAVDPHPMFYLGDSLAYLCTATMGWIPPERSFVYGLLIWLLAVPAHSLLVLVAAQALASAASAVCCTAILRRAFAAPPGVAAAAGLLCAAEPLQLMYERYVLTEPFSLLLFALFAATCFRYLRRPGAGAIGLSQVLGVLLISLRVSFLPLLLLTTAVLPLLAAGAGGGLRPTLRRWWPGRTFGGWADRRWPRAAAHLLLSGALFVGLHGGYKWLNAMLIRPELPGAGPAYNYENGLFLLSFVAPIVEKEDFADPAKADAVFAAVKYDLHDYCLRSYHRWQEGGLIKAVTAQYDDPLEANRVAERTAWNAIRRDPAGELRLAATGFADYWIPFRRESHMLADRGDRDLPPQLLAILRDDFALDGKPLPHLVTVTNRYFFAAWPWYLALLLLPAWGAAAVILSPPARRRPAVLLWLFAAAQVATTVTLTVEPSVRFLHPVAWLGVVTAGVMAAAVGKGRKRNTVSGS